MRCTNGLGGGKPALDLVIPTLYFLSMKTAISIPDDVFERAERFARKNKITRSALFSVAVEEYVQQQGTKDVTRRLNDIYSKEDSSLDPVVDQLQWSSLPQEEW